MAICSDGSAKLLRRKATFPLTFWQIIFLKLKSHFLKIEKNVKRILKHCLQYIQ